MKTFIWVTWQAEGIHKYPDAPEAVAFLRNEHRHMFHFNVHLQVFHDDRDVEFIMLKRELENLMGGNMDFKSCEMMAKDVIEYIEKHYPDRAFSVNVSEDGENGAIVYSDNYWS